VSGITLAGLGKTFPDGSAAVVDLNLEIVDGEFVALLGPSGCGKTTTLQMIAGLETISSGAILFDDVDVGSLPADRRDIAMVFQTYALYPHKTVYGNLEFGLRMRRVPKAERQRLIADALRVLGLEEHARRRPSQLSGGQRQRVALGRAMVREPKVFLLDEPLSNVDAKLRAEMRVELKALHRRLATTFIYVTHDQVEAMSMADRIAVMDRGRLQQFDNPLTIYNRPANAFVATFIGAPQINMIPGVVQEVSPLRFEAASGTFTFDGVILDVPTGTKLTLGVRPSDARLVDPAGAALVGVVDYLEPLGSDLVVGLRIGAELLTARVDPGEPLVLGARVGVEVARGRAHFFDGRDGTRLDPVLEPSGVPG
jgi:ABC-type sugar transport system ATPase subunit